MKSEDMPMVQGRRIEYRYLLAFSIILGCFLRFYQIGQQSLWVDETASYWFSSKTIPELWTIIAKFETNPPLYYTILKIWRSLFGSSEAGLRSLSAVMSIGCIPLVFMLGRLMGESIEGGWVGAIAALLFAVFSVHIEYAQEARPYAMLTFAATLTLCAFLWIMRHPAEACEPIIRKSSDPKQNPAKGSGWFKFLPWMTIIVAVTFTLWLHSTSILYIVTLSLIMLAWFFFQLRFNKTFLINIAGIAFIVFLLWGPYLIFLIPQTMSTSLPISKPTALSAIDTVVWLLFGTSISWTTVLNEIKTVAWFLRGHSIPWTTSMVNELLRAGAFVFLITLATAGLLNIRRRSGKYVSLLILGAIVGPILMELLFSLTFRPIFLARTLIYVSVPFFIAVAAGIMMLRDSRKRVLATIIISLFFLSGSYVYHVKDEKEKKEPWDRIAQTVVQQARGDVVLFVPNYLEVPFSYYAKRTTNKNLQISPLPLPMSYSGIALERLDSRIRPADIPVISSVIAEKSPVWLITRREDLYDQDRIVYNFLQQKRGLIFTQPFGEISVFKFN